MRVFHRVGLACCLTSMSCALALLGGTTAVPRPSPAPWHISRTAAAPAGPARAGTAPLTFPRLEGIYRQPGRSSAVTCLDTELADATRFAPGYFTALRAWVAAHITFPPDH